MTPGELNIFWQPNEMLAEYDFSKGVRGKYFDPLTNRDLGDETDGE